MADCRSELDVCRRGVGTGGVREVVLMALPLAAMAAASAVNALADKLFLSWHSDAAVQAIVPTASLAGTLGCLLTATVGYVSALVANAHGRGDAAGERAAFAQSVYLSLAFLPAFALFHPLGTAIICAAGHAPEVASEELVALPWLLAASAARMPSAALAGYFTGIGRTGVVGAAGIVGAVLNVALDMVLIFGLGCVPALGIAGAAIASFVSSLAELSVMAAFALRAFRLAPVNGVFGIDPGLLGKLLRLGVPHGVMSLFCGVAFTAFVMATGRCGAMELAASNIAFGVNSVFFLSVSALRDVATALVARLLGGGDDDGARRAVRSTLAVVSVCAAVFSVAALACAGLASRLFIGEASAFDESAFAGTLLAVFAVMCVRAFSEGFSETYAAALRGAGKTSYILSVRVVCVLVVWMPLVAVSLAWGASIVSLWATMPVYLLVAGFILRRRWQVLSFGIR